MSYMPQFEWDVFVSYATIDDTQLSGSDGQGWVTAFVKAFEATLASRLGTTLFEPARSARSGPSGQLRVFYAPRDLGANAPLEELLTRAGKSAVFLAVTSPAYANRDWTRKELDAFTASASDLRRLFAIEFLPLDDSESHPSPLDAHKRPKFWGQDRTTSLAAIPLSQRHETFMERVHDLADQVKKQLTTMRNLAAPIHASPSKAGTVFLAQVTDDLDNERQRLQRALEQFGIEVRPSLDLPGGGDSFRASIASEIEQCDLYVHLLGAHFGRCPVDLPEGYGAVQIDAARAAKKPMLLWRSPILNQDDLEAVPDERQRALLRSPELIASNIPQLIEQVRDRLRRRAEAPTTKPREETYVFVNAAEHDKDVAKLVQQAILARELPVGIPLYPGTNKEAEDDLIENLRNCDVMILIYGDAPQHWARKQLLQYRKYGGARKERGKSMFIGPPEDKPDDLGVELPGLKRFAFSGGWSEAQIRDALREMGL